MHDHDRPRPHGIDLRRHDRGALSVVVLLVVVAIAVAATAIGVLVATRPPPIAVEPIPKPQPLAVDPGRASDPQPEPTRNEPRPVHTPAFMRDTGEIGPVAAVPAPSPRATPLAAPEAIELPPAVATIPVQQDAHVRGGEHADRNFGDASDLVVKGSGNEDYRRQAFLQFELTQMPADFAAVHLVVVPIKFGDDIARDEWEVALMAASTTTWSEATLTDRNQPTDVAAALTVPALLVKNRPWVVDVTFLIRTHLAHHPDRPCTLRLTVERNTNQTGAHIATREHEELAGPHLHVTGP